MTNIYEPHIAVNSHCHEYWLMESLVAAHLVAEVPPWLSNVEELCEEDACHCQHSPPTEQAGVNVCAQRLLAGGKRSS